MQIAFDSNVFYKDPNLKGEDWTLLEQFVQGRRPTVLLPQLVFEEVVNKVCERLQSAYSKIKSEQREISSLTEKQYKLTNIKIPKERKAFELRLHRRLRECRIQLLNYPAITHQDIVARDLSRRKPFAPDGEGRGYRDALIWHTLIEYLRDNPDDVCIFITENCSDFCSSRHETKVLHADLQADLDKARIKTKVQIRSSLAEFVAEFVKPTLKKLEDLRRSLTTGAPIRLKRYLETREQAVLDGVRSLDFPMTFPFDFEGVEITMLDGPLEIEVGDVYELNDKQAYIEFSGIYEADIDAYLRKTDVLGLDKTDRVNVTDWDWNEQYAEVGASVILKVEFGLTYNQIKKRVVGFEVKDAAVISA